MNDTIVALSTPIGTGAISIVRMSGNKSLDIAKQFFIGPDFSAIKPRYMYFGKLVLEKFTENCLMVYFKEPFSYTGNDIVEFQIHGSEFLSKIVIEKCVSLGARLADRGEFTKLAFLNGKISLDKAEGIIDEINASSEAELRAVSSLTNGMLFKQISSIQGELTDIIASLEVELDYPEHETLHETTLSLKSKIGGIKNNLCDILASSQSGQVIKSGINIAICGRPNAGKSSLLNAILGEERAIVTNTPGTTRDTIKESIVYDGFKMNFIDTAGLRKSDDVVECIGIERSYKEIKNADIVLYLVDESKAIFDDELQEIKSIENGNLIIVGNKNDKKLDKIDFKGVFEGFSKCFLEISATNCVNIEKLKHSIYETVLTKKIDFSKIVLTNLRHIENVKKSIEICDNILNLADSTNADIYSLEVKSLWNSLGKITGLTENENIIDTIFAKFCLGK